MLADKIQDLILAARNRRMESMRKKFAEKLMRDIEELEEREAQRRSVIEDLKQRGISFTAKATYGQDGKIIKSTIIFEDKPNIKHII
jgi:hypothetical protein